MRMKTPLRVAAAAASFALLVTACGGGSETETDASNTDSTSDPNAPSGGTYSVNLTEPSYLAPFANCYESECSKVLDLVNDPLVSVNVETGELVYDGLLASVEPNDDQSVWTITIKEGRTFQNGEPVTADGFIRTWNYTANPKNEQATAGFMSHIEGASEGNQMSGLKKIDDLTFEVTLTSPFSQFPLTLSYGNAWHPLAEACFDDIQACNEKPIGTGPYMMEGKWNHDQGITLTKWADYQGDQEAQADTIQFKMFADAVSAFRAWQGGTLDLLDNVDPTIYGEAVQQAGDRILTEESTTLTYMGFPVQTAPYDSKKYRQGFSMAFDRQSIIDGVLNGQAVPATDIVPPAFAGHRDSACNYCQLDVDRAKELFQAGGGSSDETIEIFFNAGAGHEGWTEAIGNQLKNNLGVDFKLRATEWAQYLEILDAGDFTGPFRLGWLQDYPSMENYVRPLVSTNGDSNYSNYSNPEVDQNLKKGDQAQTQEEAIEFYQAADDAALEDMPILPLWFGIDNIIWSDNLSNINYSVESGGAQLNKVIVQ
ncbi:MAG TPA: ABC transporter substrate-binding protein [Nocardioidaceae bacterium]|nr:ABC transporter substrate-binding protein [Nocardioidaceae bacterium]